MLRCVYVLLAARDGLQRMNCRSVDEAEALESVPFYTRPSVPLRDVVLLKSKALPPTHCRLK